MQYSASWSVNAPVRSDYKLTVYYRPDANVWGGWTANDISDANFAVTSSSSLTLTVTSPNGSESWQSGSTQDLRWEISGPVAEGAFNLWLVDGEGNWLNTVGAVLAEAGRTQYSASWQVNVPVRSEYKLTVYYRPDANVWGGWTANDISDNAFAVTPMFVAAGGGRGPLSTTIVTSYTFVDPVPTVNNQTMRVMLRTTAGGSQVAVKLTNRFSSVALPVGAAHVAIQSMGGTIVSGSDRTLTFSGAGGVTIPANAEVWSDPASLAVTHGDTLAISVYVTGNLTPTTESGRGNLSWMKHYLSGTGNHTSDPTMSGATTTHTILFVAEVRVLPATPAATLVTLGDSITEGACSSAPNGDWPDLLSDRLPTLPDGTPVSVFNAGIGSGRFQSSDGAGLSGIKRLPELLALPSVRWVTILMGVNDISYEGTDENNHNLNNLINAYQSAITQAHAAGVKVIGIPILPFRHSTKDVGTNWATAQTVNAWIRAPGHFDAVIDFEPVVGDPGDPGSMKASLTCDHVHPNQAGYTAMANAIDLAIFH
jgi:lysophospholipase L1-like esterase